MNIFEKLIEKQFFLVLDGAMGTYLDAMNLSEDEFRGEALKNHSVPLKGNFDILSITNPQIIRNIHRQYLQVGAQVIKTNSFNANIFAQKPYKTEHLIYEVNRAAAEIARQSCGQFVNENSSKQYIVAGVAGPTPVFLSKLNSQEFKQQQDVLTESYYQQWMGLIDGGADLLILETVVDSINAQIALESLHKIFDKNRITLPYVISATLDKKGCLMYSGETLEEFVGIFSKYNPFAFGLNCSYGAGFLADFAVRLFELSRKKICFYPSAGMPGKIESPEKLASIVKKLFDRNMLVMAGGCCGTNPEYIRQIEKATAPNI